MSQSAMWHSKHGVYKRKQPLPKSRGFALPDGRGASVRLAYKVALVLSITPSAFHSSGNVYSFYLARRLRCQNSLTVLEKEHNRWLHQGVPFCSAQKYR